MTLAVRLLLLAVGWASLGGCGEEQASDQPPADVVMAGAWDASNLADPTVQSVARFAAARVGDGGGVLDDLVAATQRSADGTLYRMQIRLQDENRWVVIARRNIDGSMELIDSSPVPKVAEPLLKLDPGGLRISTEDGTERFIAFGATPKEVLRATSFRGVPGQSVNGECPSGPVAFLHWPDGLDLLFQDEKFAGWALDAGPLKTLNGAGIGATLTELRRAGPVVVEQTTLGPEFVVDGIGGVLDGSSGKARVTHMWAGVSCVFR